LSVLPIAQQLLDEVQLTLLRFAPAAAWAEIASQFDPSQWSISPVTLLFMSWAYPTAQQSVAELQLKPESWLYADGCGRLDAACAPDA
jgi:hypothetical protein